MSWWCWTCALCALVSFGAFGPKGMNFWCMREVGVLSRSQGAEREKLESHQKSLINPHI